MSDRESDESDAIEALIVIIGAIPTLIYRIALLIFQIWLLYHLAIALFF